jgi:hypothetical protein
MISEIIQGSNSLNPEIIESIEKISIKSNMINKEQREKNIKELYKTVLLKISKILDERNSNELMDLIFDKSIQICEITKEYEWPGVKDLKVSNLNRFTNFFYIYIRSRLILYSNKSKKNIQETAIKACDNLLKLLNILIDNTGIIENNLYYMIFYDLFEFFLLSNKNEETKNEIDNLIDLYLEETNISGLIKMENIADSAKTNFFLGSLCKLFQLKISLIYEEKKEDIKNDINNIIKHEKILRDTNLVLNIELNWYAYVIKFIEKDITEEDVKSIKNIIDISNIYIKFLKISNSNFNEIIYYNVNKLKSLMILILIKEGVKINKNILFAINVDYNYYDLYLNAVNNDTFYIKKILNNPINIDYIKLKFDKEIMNKINKNENNYNKFLDIILGENKIDYKEYFDLNKYIEFKKNENKKFNDLILCLDKIN